jgi:hypothetical protein
MSEAPTSEVGAPSEASRLSAGFDSVVQAGLAALQGNIIKATKNTAERYFKIAKEDEDIWNSLYKPAMAKYANEVFSMAARPLDRAFFRARNLRAQAEMQGQWYNARLQISRYSFGARETLDYSMDIAVREARANSAFYGVAMAEAYFETYKEQRRAQWAKTVSLGRKINGSAMGMLAQAVDMKQTAGGLQAEAVSTAAQTYASYTEERNVNRANAALQKDLGTSSRSEGATSLGAQVSAAANAVVYGAPNRNNVNLGQQVSAQTAGKF